MPLANAYACQDHWARPNYPIFQINELFPYKHEDKLGTMFYIGINTPTKKAHLWNS